MKALSTENNIRVWKGKYFVVEHIRMCQNTGVSMERSKFPTINWSVCFRKHTDKTTKQNKTESKHFEHTPQRFKHHFDYKLLLVFSFPWPNEFWFLFFFLQQSFCNRGGKKDTQREDAQVLTHSPRQTLQKVLLEITAWLSVDWMKQSLSLSTLYLEKYLFSLNTVSSCSHVLINSKILLSIVQL